MVGPSGSKGVDRGASTWYDFCTGSFEHSECVLCFGYGIGGTFNIHTFTSRAKASKNQTKSVHHSGGPFVLTRGCQQGRF